MGHRRTTGGLWGWLFLGSTGALTSACKDPPKPEPAAATPSMSTTSAPTQEPVPRTEPGTAAYLPSPREVAAGVRIVAALHDPKVEARETLVVYAFSDLEDFRTLRPEVGGTAKDGASYAAMLTERLQSVPLSRWARVVTGYTILPGK